MLDILKIIQFYRYTGFQLSEEVQSSSQEGILAKIKAQIRSLLSKDNEVSEKGQSPKTESPKLIACAPEVIDAPSTVAENEIDSPPTSRQIYPSRERIPVEDSRAKMHQLYNKYCHLLDEHNQINSEKDELTKKVDLGELTSSQAHMEMVSLTRQAAQLAEVMRELSERLSELGHPRFKKYQPS